MMDDWASLSWSDVSSAKRDTAELRKRLRFAQSAVQNRSRKQQQRLSFSTAQDNVLASIANNQSRITRRNVSTISTQQKKSFVSNADTSRDPRRGRWQRAEEENMEDKTANALLRKLSRLSVGHISHDRGSYSHGKEDEGEDTDEGDRRLLVLMEQAALLQDPSLDFSSASADRKQTKAHKKKLRVKKRKTEKQLMGGKLSELPTLQSLSTFSRHAIRGCVQLLKQKSESGVLHIDTMQLQEVFYHVRLDEEGNPLYGDKIAYLDMYAVVTAAAVTSESDEKNSPSSEDEQKDDESKESKGASGEGTMDKASAADTLPCPKKQTLLRVGHVHIPFDVQGRIHRARSPQFVTRKHSPDTAAHLLAHHSFPSVAESYLVKSRKRTHGFASSSSPSSAAAAAAATDTASRRSYKHKRADELQGDVFQYFLRLKLEEDDDVVVYVNQQLEKHLAGEVEAASAEVAAAAQKMVDERKALQRKKEEEEEATKMKRKNRVYGRRW